MKPFRYALFDVDGTLIDSMRYWQWAGFEHFAAKGYTLPPRETIPDGTFTTNIYKNFEILSSMADIPPEEAGDLNTYIPVIARHYEEDITSLRPGVKESLLAMKESGVALGIFSASFVQPITKMMKRFEVFSLFDFAITAESFPKGKRNPAMFRAAVSAFGEGVTPEEVVLFEDAFYSIDMGRSLGMRIVGIEDASEGRKNEVRNASEIYFEGGVWRPEEFKFDLK